MKVFKCSEGEEEEEKEETAARSKEIFDSSRMEISGFFSSFNLYFFLNYHSLVSSSYRKEFKKSYLPFV